MPRLKNIFCPQSRHAMKQHSVYHFFCACLLSLGISVSAFAQEISGTVQDTTERKPVSMAVVMLLYPTDSTLAAFTRTQANGKFNLKAPKAGKYLLEVSHPSFGAMLDEVQLDATPQTLGTLALTPRAKLMQEVIVRAGAPMKIKGDTVIYTADSFKVSANANVEELLRKLPGIQVGKNGEIKAMGKTVEKVLVDGEAFFGDDPGMAVKNLRADAVKEVQVFDKKSEQAEFTGIDDGKTQKTINLKLKEDRKRGFFGKAEVSGGTVDKIDDRYNNNLMINAFKGKRKIAAYLLQGNTGQNGLNWQDQQKYGGSDDNVSFSVDEEGMQVTRWMGNEEDPWIDTRNGFFENLNVGGQYTNKWGDKQSVNFSPKVNRLLYDNTRSIFNQIQLGDSLLNNNTNERQAVAKRNIKNNLVYDLKIDSLRSLKFTTKLNVYNTENSTESQSLNTSKTGIRNNDAITNQITENNRTVFGQTILYKQKFKKDRRTLSAQTDLNFSRSETDGFLYAINNLYAGGLLARTDSIDQQKDNRNIQRKADIKLAYTEPLSKTYALELNYEFSWVNGENDQLTLSKSNSSSDKYDQLVDSLSNRFQQDFFTHKTGFRISHKTKKIRYSIGSSAGFTRWNLNDLTANQPSTRRFTNLFPSANFNYTYKANHSFGVEYNGRTMQPSLTQLQNLRNNNNPLNEVLGNPNLNQSFRHSFGVNHNSYNFLKEMWTYQSINVDFTQNAITQSRIIEANGKTITQPINTNGNMNLNSWMGMGTKVTKLKLDFNMNLSFNYNRFNDFINQIRNTTNTYSASVGFNIGKQKEKKYEIYINNDFGYNINRTTLFGSPIRYATNTVGMNGAIYMKKTWKLSSNIEYNVRQQTEQFSGNVNNTLWNAMLEKTFRKDEFTVFFTVRDILNQNIGIDRNFGGNSLTEIRNDRLQRFFLLGFRWDFKNNGPKPKS
jgi:hypothetical protein